MRLQRHARALACVAMLALSVPGTPAQVQLPALGDSVSDGFSVGSERRLGEQVMAEIRRDPDYLDDPLLLEYLQRLWLPLVQAARQRGDIVGDVDRQFAWETFLVRDRSVNAFALPGGFVGVHLGLIAMTGSADELASVLAHELTHVTQRHIARSIANAQRQGMIGTVAMLLGMIAASRAGSTDLAQAAVVGSQAAMAQGQLNFSRDMEREADRVGHGVLTGAGFSAAGMAEMFDKLENANRLNDGGSYPYLRSHPLTVERIGEARLRTAVAARPAAAHERLEHALMQARARALMDPAVAAWRRLQEQDRGGSAGATEERIAALYASALASSLLRDAARAEAAADEALKLLHGRADVARAERALRLLRLQLLIERGDAERAAQALAELPAEPGARVPMLMSMQVALLPRRARAAEPDAALRRSVETLQAWVAEHRDDATAWGWLAQGAEALGLRLRSMRAQAEMRAALGDRSGAIDRLRAAQAVARSGGANADFIESSVIDARLRQLLAERRQQAADARGRGPGGAEPGR